MQSGLVDQHFSNFVEVKNWTVSWVSAKSLNFFRKVIRELPEIWVKVVAKDWKYFEY